MRYCEITTEIALSCVSFYPVTDVTDKYQFASTIFEALTQHRKSEQAAVNNTRTNAISTGFHVTFESVCTERAKSRLFTIDS